MFIENLRLCLLRALRHCFWIFGPAAGVVLTLKRRRATTEAFLIAAFCAPLPQSGMANCVEPAPQSGMAKCVEPAKAVLQPEADACFGMLMFYFYFSYFY